MKYDSSGFLEIHTFTAGGALPVPHINVRIIGTEEGNVGITYSFITGRDGISDAIELPAPSVKYSLAPGAEEQPFAHYDVEAYGFGYYPKKIIGVTVFSGIKTILPMEMIPDAEYQRNTPSPNGANYSIITENEELS